MTSNQNVQFAKSVKRESRTKLIFVCESCIEFKEQLLTLAIKEFQEFIYFDYEDRLRILFDKFHTETPRYF